MVLSGRFIVHAPVGGTSSSGTAQRQRRMKLLVYIGEFFSAYHEKKPERALQVLDEAGILQSTMQRVEVTCPITKQQGGTVHVTDRLGQRHAVRIPAGVQGGESFVAEVRVQLIGHARNNM